MGRLSVFGCRFSARLGAMRRLLIVMLGLLLYGAQAQEHKISVQKYEVPQYPAIARQARVQGNVKLGLDVSPTGEVTSVKVISGHPLLNQTAIDNIKLWRFHCDDCAYGQAFEHEIVFGFRISGDSDPELWMQFPRKIIIYTEPPIIDTIVARSPI